MIEQCIDYNKMNGIKQPKYENYGHFEPASDVYALHRCQLTTN
jgi:hypothetical protein